jgi:hypothetical protein
VIHRRVSTVAVLDRLARQGLHAGPPRGWSVVRWRKALRSLCKLGFLRIWSWEVDGVRFTPTLPVKECPSQHLYVAGPRWGP